MSTRILLYRSLIAAALLTLLLQLFPVPCSLAQGLPVARASGVRSGRAGGMATEMQVAPSDDDPPTTGVQQDDAGSASGEQMVSAEPALYQVFMPRIQVPEARYVAPYGDDDNPGTRTEPWATLGHAARMAEPGNLVILRQGVYEAGRGDTFTVSGTPGWPIVFRAEYPGAAVLQYDDSVAYKWNLDGVSHLVFEGLVLDGGRAEASACVRLADSSHITFRNCVIQETRGHGIRIHGGNSHILVENCEIRPNFHEGPGRDGIQIYATEDRGPDEYITIRKCEIHETDHNGIVVSDARHVVIERNEIYAVHSHGITPVRGCDDVVIRYNVLHGEDGWADLEANPWGMKEGIFVHYDGVRNLYIYGNTIYHTSSSAIYLRDGIVGAVEIHHNTFHDNNGYVEYADRGAVHLYNITTEPRISVRDNIISTLNPRAMHIESGCTIANLDMDHNLWYAEGSDGEIRRLRPVYPFSKYHLFEPNSLFDVDPMFVDADAGNFALSSASPVAGWGFGAH